MAVKFQPKPGKPHIILKNNPDGWYLWPRNWGSRDTDISARNYCRRVNPIFYSTQGAAARALHYGSEKK